MLPVYKMKPTLFFRLGLLLAVCAVGPLTLRAQDLNTVKARMEERQPAVDALKDRHVAGENNRGYLELRGAAVGPDQQVVSDENSDRRAVYAALAAQTGANADTVGRTRAQQIAIRSKRGVWLQSPNGEWRQK